MIGQIIALVIGFAVIIGIGIIVCNKMIKNKKDIDGIGF
jgi:hypothetical protein